MRATGSGAPAGTVDVVLIAWHGRAHQHGHERELAVLLVRQPGQPWTLPWAPVDGRDTLDAVAARIAQHAAGERAGWLEQCGCIGGPARHATNAPLSIAYVGVVPPPDGRVARSRGPAGSAWHSIGAMPPLSPRQRAMLDAALLRLRERLDHAPVAFRLLGETFTLSDLQSVYELLLGRRLHKASFRRALLAAHLVEPTNAWRSEGRGRPAQFYRYAPRRRRASRGGVRFDTLGA
jgi:8-oxo-dGTP diphosphatase